MIENSSIGYRINTLYIDNVPLPDIVEQQETPFYVYSLPRALENLHRIKTAFAELKPHIHYSMKSNSNLALLRALVGAGAGIDAVSAGEIHRALKAGAAPHDIVFAGVGKTRDEIRYALEQHVGWFNVENVLECDIINDEATKLKTRARVALRLNPDIAADTHRHIATGHGKAKFGLTADQVAEIFKQQANYPQIDFVGIHIHIGSNLHSTDATRAALEKALSLIAPYPQMRTVNIGGGLPVAYRADEQIPPFTSFAETLTPLLKGYDVLLEPGRAIIADAGVLVTKILYVKEQAGETFVICDASMSELIRPALYDAHHEIVPVLAKNTLEKTAIVVGPVCETTDVLGRDVPITQVQEGDSLAILTAGAYGMVMASTYNQRPRPAEVVIRDDGASWEVARRRETWEDMLRFEE